MPARVRLAAPAKRAVAVAGAVLLVACATPEQPPAPPEPVKETPPEVSAAKPKKEAIKSQPLKYLVGRNLKPMPDKALDVRTRCGFKDVGGGHGSMDLQVTKAEVKRFVAEVSIPKQGLCRFDLKDFEQTAKMPNVVLTDKSGTCTVRMWEQEKGVTVAFNSCQTQCSGDAFSYLWPILVDTRSGRCA
ncbi:hypothetical protein [Propionivibrio soli]|uniref:hypothetical protein n=1 Tax=Propionivibrio soli TaxID=2976531 RepID=UPI0021E97599|nr:hypothetical protein [Propionivibrio soli]